MLYNIAHQIFFIFQEMKFYRPKIKKLLIFWEVKLLNKTSYILEMKFASSQNNKTSLKKFLIFREI